MQPRGNAVTPASGQGREAREDFRHPTTIRASVRIGHAWEGAGASNLPADLINVSCGGASLRVYWVFPPRTRLLISLQAAASTVDLEAEVVWTSLLPGRRPEPAIYGIRWSQRLPSRELAALLGQATPM